MAMTANMDGKAKQHRTTMVPVTTMEEIAVLSENERAELLESLKQAEARIEAGQAVDYDRKSFRERPIATYRGSKR
jgi:hypothetical protein